MDNSYRTSFQALTRATFDDKEIDNCHKTSSFISNGKTYFVEFNYPLLVERGELIDVIEFSLENTKYRIYPPFILERKEAKAASFEQIYVPVADSLQCNSYVKLPENRVTSVDMGPGHEHGNSNTFTYCHGLRIDVLGIKANLDKGLEYFLRVVAEKTHQWWIKAANNPFDQGIRLCAYLLDDYQLPTKFKEEINADGVSKVTSPWMASNVFQSQLGFEKAINHKLWSVIKNHLEQSLETNVGIENFNAGISEYMNNQDEKSILSFSLCFEILENKHRETRNKKDTNIKKLFNESVLINDRIRPVLRDLIVIDRGHVAHGKKPHKIGSGTRNMEEYIEAMFQFLNAYNHEY